MKTIITAIVVSVVISGAASAGVTTLISSRQIKDHTIQLRDMSASAVGQLEGQPGARGPGGPKGDTGATGAPGPQGLKGEPAESNGLYVRTATITIEDKGEGDANPTVLDLKCDPGDPMVSAPTWWTDPPQSTWSDMNALHPLYPAVTVTKNELAYSYSWNGGVGTHVTLSECCLLSLAWLCGPLAERANRRARRWLA